MRFVIIGAGAIGGVVGASLHQAGHDVALVARGAHYDAIAAGGLTFETPSEATTLRIRVERTPADVGIEAQDIVMLATKSQDAAGALATLRAAAPASTPVVCMQNGVENERLALRLFANVYGAVVMSPTAHLEPGSVLAYGTARLGAIDVGCFPRGTDERGEAICAALTDARFESEPRAEIMRAKYAKLISNLANAVQGVCGDGPDTEALIERVQAEGRAVLTAAGIEFREDGVADIAARWKRWRVGEIEGRPRGGGSTWQSIVRGAGSVETDYLNGEIVLQARLAGRMAPANELLQELAQQTLRDGRAPGWLTAAEVLARLPPE